MTARRGQRLFYIAGDLKKSWVSDRSSVSDFINNGNHCNFFGDLTFLEVRSPVMVMIPRGEIYARLLISFCFLKPRFPPHNNQRIDANTDATNSTTTTMATLHHSATRTNTHSTDTSHHTTPHQAHSSFQHRRSPASFEVARGWHRNSWTTVFCMMRTCSPDRMSQGTCNLVLRASQSRVYRGSHLNE